MTTWAFNPLVEQCVGWIVFVYWLCARHQLYSLLRVNQFAVVVVKRYVPQNFVVSVHSRCWQFFAVMWQRSCATGVSTAKIDDVSYCLSATISPKQNDAVKSAGGVVKLCLLGAVWQMEYKMKRWTDTDERQPRTSVAIALSSRVKWIARCGNFLITRLPRFGSAFGRKSYMCCTASRPHS